MAAASVVTAQSPIGSPTEQHYPTSLLRPDYSHVEPRIGLAWRPVPASSLVIRAGYGIYSDTSVYQSTALQLAEQTPFATSLSVNNADCASSADTGAAFGQDNSEFNVFNTDRQLSALQTAAAMLGQLNEKKALLYFASGLRLNGLNNQAQMHATVEAAIRAGVSFWPMDARTSRHMVSQSASNRRRDASVRGFGESQCCLFMTGSCRAEALLWPLRPAWRGVATSILIWS